MSFWTYRRNRRKHLPYIAICTSYRLISKAFHIDFNFERLETFSLFLQQFSSLVSQNLAMFCPALKANNLYIPALELIYSSFGDSNLVPFHLWWMEVVLKYEMVYKSFFHCCLEILFFVLTSSKILFLWSSFSRKKST